MLRIKAKKNIIKFQKDTGGTFIWRKQDLRYADKNNVVFPESTLMMPPVGNETHWRHKTTLNLNKGGQGDE